MSRWWLLAAVALAACGGSQPEGQVAEPGAAAPTAREPRAAEQEEPADPEAEAEATGIPTKCAKSDPCRPPAGFVKRLCNDTYRSVAIYLFSKASPFARGYVTRKTEAWNASGGVSGGGYLEFDEEVLVLRTRKADLGGMQVSGAGGGYDALRWDGSCVTLDERELTLQRPPTPKAAKVEFRYLESHIQDALRQDEGVNEAYRARRQECKGATSGTVSLKCVKADAKLAKLVVDYVRAGGAVPQPEQLP